MIISKIVYNRKFNLGNYETQDLTIEAQLNEKDNPLEVWTILADNTEMWHIDYMRKRNAESGGAAKSTPNVQSSPNQPPNSPPKASIDKIKQRFPSQYESELTFEQKGEYCIIKPKQFLGPIIFGDICGIIREIGGEYISAGKDSHSHWRVKA